MGGINRTKDCYIIPAGPANRSQRNSAKEAIVWLLGRAKFSAEDISEHFGLQKNITLELLQELVDSGRVKRFEKGGGVFGLSDPLGKWFLKKS